MRKLSKPKKQNNILTLLSGHPTPQHLWNIVFLGVLEILSKFATTAMPSTCWCFFCFCHGLHQIESKSIHSDPCVPQCLLCHVHVLWPSQKAQSIARAWSSRQKIEPIFALPPLPSFVFKHCLVRYDDRELVDFTDSMGEPIPKIHQCFQSLCSEPETLHTQCSYCPVPSRSDMSLLETASRETGNELARGSACSRYSCAGCSERSLGNGPPRPGPINWRDWPPIAKIKSWRAACILMEPVPTNLSC